MQYVQLGNSGLIVSRLVMGTMTYGVYDFYGMKSNVTEADALAMTDRALAAGINFFDCADMYGFGQSEQILGRVLGKRRGDAIIATKCYFRTGPAVVHGGLSRRHIMDACEASLRRLGTDWIDLYLLHDWDPVTPVEETARALEDLQKQGKIRYPGQCNFAAWQAESMLSSQRLHGWAPLVASQVYYSLVGRDIERHILPHAARAGMGIMAWSPLASGFLTGKYTRENIAAADGRRAAFNFPPVDTDRGFEVVDVLREVAGAQSKSNPDPAASERAIRAFAASGKLSAAAQATGAGLGEYALAWMLAKPAITTVIIGASKMSQLESNLRATGVNLSPFEIGALDAVGAGGMARLRDWLRVRDGAQIPDGGPWGGFVTPATLEGLPAAYPEWIQGGEPGIMTALTQGWTPGDAMVV